EEDYWRAAAGAFLSGVEGFDAVVCDRNEQAAGYGYGGGKFSKIMIKKVSKHIVQNEPLLFEQSSPGKWGYQLPPLDVPAVDAAKALGAENVRSEITDFPEVSEFETLRHFTRLSTWNYAIDLGLYPLGSCTMK